MKIKYLLTTIAATAMVLFVSSCEDELDLQPNNSFTDESVFTTPDRVNLAINGVYDAAQSGFYNGAIDRGYPFGAANVAQGDNRGEDVVNIQAFYQITYQATYGPTSANNVNYWNSLYRLINFSNIAIEGLDKAAAGNIITADVASSAKAEMLFMRAWSHFETVVFFARPFLDGNGSALGVPYRDYAVSGADAVNQLRADARPTVGENYTKILADLDGAIAGLPAKQSIAANSKIRAEKAAAITLKMKVLMHMGRFQEAKAEGDKLVPAAINPAVPTSVVSPIGGYSLTAAPAASFTGNSITSENIFTIKHDPLDNPNTNASLPRMYGSTTSGGRGLVSISPILWNRTEWVESDKRRSSLYALASNANSTMSVFTTKYPDPVGQGANNPIFRYAEVLLMLAECEARISSGVSQRAVDLLNVVRNRSISSELTAIYTVADFASQTDLVNAILWEFRFEFAAEGRRWHTISRTILDPIAALRPAGIPAKLLSGAGGAALFGFGVALPTTLQPAIPYADFRFIWPIPADEITQNPVIVQNPGY